MGRRPGRAKGIVDNYPLPPEDPEVTVTPADVKRLLGIDLTPNEMARPAEPVGVHPGSR